MNRQEIATSLNKVLADHELDNAKWSKTEDCVQVWCKCGATFFYKDDVKIHDKHSGGKLLEEVERLIARAIQEKELPQPSPQS